jgi:hypothetical protein
MDAKDRRIAELEELLKAALEEIARLKAQLNKNSSNSSKPPSSDLVKPPKQQKDRRRKKRKIGGQKTHDILVQLYTMEPRADAELLELIADTNYPEKEKVAILMELGIPYKNYRIWESFDGLFKANAQYVSSGEKGVTLEKADGKQTTIEFDVLRVECQEYVKQLLAAEKDKEQKPD